VSKRGTWRKIHLAIEEKTGQILSQRLTHKDTNDASQLPELVQEVQQAGVGVQKVGGDGAYATWECYQILKKVQVQPMIPPRENAALWVDQQDILLDHPRNQALEQIHQGGLNAKRKQWKQESGYHRGSKVENTFFRWKTIQGPAMDARKMANQQTEAAVKLAVLNRFIQIDTPIAVKVA
jgi:transposase